MESYSDYQTLNEVHLKKDLLHFRGRFAETHTGPVEQVCSRTSRFALTTAVY